MNEPQKELKDVLDESDRLAEQLLAKMAEEPMPTTDEAEKDGALTELIEAALASTDSVPDFAEPFADVSDIFDTAPNAVAPAQEAATPDEIAAPIQEETAPDEAVAPTQEETAPDEIAALTREEAAPNEIVAPAQEQDEARGDKEAAAPIFTDSPNGEQTIPAPAAQNEDVTSKSEQSEGMPWHLTDLIEEGDFAEPEAEAAAITPENEASAAESQVAPTKDIQPAADTVAVAEEMSRDIEGDTQAPDESDFAEPRAIVMHETEGEAQEVESAPKEAEGASQEAEGASQESELHIEEQEAVQEPVQEPAAPEIAALESAKEQKTAQEEAAPAPAAPALPKASEERPLLVDEEIEKGVTDSREGSDFAELALPRRRRTKKKKQELYRPGSTVVRIMRAGEEQTGAGADRAARPSPVVENDPDSPWVERGRESYVPPVRMPREENLGLWARRNAAMQAGMPFSSAVDIAEARVSPQRERAMPAPNVTERETPPPVAAVPLEAPAVTAPDGVAEVLPVAHGGSAAPVAALEEIEKEEVRREPEGFVPAQNERTGRPAVVLDDEESEAVAPAAEAEPQAAAPVIERGADKSVQPKAVIEDAAPMGVEAEAVIADNEEVIIANEVAEESATDGEGAAPIENVTTQAPPAPQIKRQDEVVVSVPHVAARPDYHDTFKTEKEELSSFKRSLLWRKAPKEGKLPTMTTEPPRGARVEVDSALDGIMNELFGSRGGQPSPTLDTTAEPTAPAAHSEEQPLAPDVVDGQDGQIALLFPEAARRAAVVRPARANYAAREGEAAEQIDIFDDGRIAPDGSSDPVSPANSDAEFAFLMEMDYENELGETVGFEKVLAYREEGVNGQPVQRRRRRRQGEKREFESQGQAAGFRRTYQRRKGSLVWRLSVTLLLTLLLFLYEKPQLTARLGGPFDGTRYPTSYILFGMQLLLIGVVLYWHQLLEGMLRLLHFSPINYSLCSVTVLLTLAYHAALLLLPFEGVPTLYLSPAAAVLAVLALSELFDWYREFSAFLVISSTKQKYALIPRASVGGRTNGAKERLYLNERAEQVWYVRPVGFVRNYFANTEKKVEHNRSLGSQLMLVLAAGTAAALYTFAAKGSKGLALQAAFVTFLVSMPAISMLVTSLPMFLAACLRLGKNGAIVGEEMVYGCGGPTSLVLPDGALFGSMNHERFEMIESCDAERVTVLVRAVLEKLQSPMMDSLSVEDRLAIPAASVVLHDIRDEGVRAEVGEERTEVLLGSLAYLQQNGVRVRARSGSEFADFGRRMLCVAIDGRVTALFLTRYRLTEDATDLIKTLQDENLRLVVRTKDACIHDALLSELLPDAEDTVKVMKPSPEELDIRTDRVDATVVALGSCSNAARAFVVCRRIRKAGNFGKILQGISIGAGIALSALMTVFGLTATVQALAVTMYSLLWYALHATVSYVYLKKKELK